MFTFYDKKCLFSILNLLLHIKSSPIFSFSRLKKVDLECLHVCGGITNLRFPHTDEFTILQITYIIDAPYYDRPMTRVSH